VPSLTIDHRTVPFEPGETLLQVAARTGIAIPTLCHYPGIESPTSCFVCVVKICGRGALAPSCATRAEEGMVVESDTEEVRLFRRKALELLMSEHAGDCEAPCTRVCPADLDISAMARHVFDGDLERAVRTVRERLALPGVLGYICPAPCEKGCRRSAADGAVSIRALHRGVAEAEYAAGTPALTARPASGKRVAVVGAGPAGLSCAYYLARLGHACVVFDGQEAPGGLLRYGIDRAALPAEVLDRDIEEIRRLGVAFRMGETVADQNALDGLARSFDAVVLATGTPVSGQPWPWGLRTAGPCVAVETGTFASSRSGVFACGGVIAVCRMASRAVGQGRLAALSAHRFLTADAAVPPTASARSDSRLGKLEPEELRQLVETDLASRGAGGKNGGPFPAALVAAAGRCLQCDCGKKQSCALRAYAREYGVDRDRYRTGSRKPAARTRCADRLMVESGKCIDCGRCVGIAAADHLRPGVTFCNRGFDVAVKVPFGADMEVALGAELDRCIAACPVGALWNWKRQDGTR